MVQRRGSYSWRCPSKGCQTFTSVRNNSFFSRSHLKLDVIVELLYFWSKQMRVTDAAKEVGCTQRVAIDWFNFIRDVCAQYFLDHPIAIGGPGKIVEIDESKFGKRKYNRGRGVDGHWVFGGIERGTTKSFMIVVADRSAATLIPIIQTYILPGTLIISDEWRAYSSLSSLGYQHQTVNHSQNFVDPGTGAHTNSVEGYWSCVKRQMRRQGVMNTSNDLFSTYLLESLWRKRFHGQDLFEKLLECIAVGLAPD